MPSLLIFKCSFIFQNCNILSLKIFDVIVSIKYVSFKIRFWEVGDCSPAPPPWALSVGGVALGAHVPGNKAGF